MPLGVLLKNENKAVDMVDIVTHLHQYIPVYEYSKTFQVPGTGDEVEVLDASLHRIFFGGDQVTAARARGAVRAKMNSLSPVTQLAGIIPCAEDWHTKLNLLDVSIYLI